MLSRREGLYEGNVGVVGERDVMIFKRRNQRVRMKDMHDGKSLFNNKIRL
jgi:hypothetical protein